LINLIIHGIYSNIKEHVLGFQDYFIENNIKFTVNFHTPGTEVKPSIMSDINLIFSGKRVVLPKNDSCNILFENHNNKFRHFNNPQSDYSQFYKVVQFCKDNMAEDNCIYFPVCYNKYFDPFNGCTNIDESADIFYFGSIIEYRVEFLEKFSIPYLTCYGEERDRKICEAKINLLINRWKNNYDFAPLHAFLSWCKGKIVLVDKNIHYEEYGDYVIEFTEETFEDVKNYWLERDKERREFGAFIRESLIAKYNAKTLTPQLMKKILPL